MRRRDGGGSGCAGLRMGPWVVLLVLLAAAWSPGEEPAPIQELRLEWQTVQQSRDRQARRQWWQAMSPARLDVYLRAGVDVRIEDRRGWTPLHSAARHCPDAGVLTALIRAGAAVDARDRAGDTALHWAAAENPNPEIVDVLLAAGAEVNRKDRFGWTPLHCAANMNPNPDIVIRLLEAGADPKKKAYFILFTPRFLLRHNDHMSDEDRSRVDTLLR